MTYNKEILNRFLTEKVAIAVRTYEEWDKFMCLLEAETDVQWASGSNPTKKNYWHEYGYDSTIACGYTEPLRVEYTRTSYYKESGYEIIEFEELIKGEEKMVDKEKGSLKLSDYKGLFTRTKIEGFVNSLYALKENIQNYKGYLLVEGSYRQKEYFDFLSEMKGYGIERDEIEKIIIEDYLTKKESDQE